MIRHLSVAAVFATLLFGASCEKHSWEETKKLHHHGGGHEEGHGDSADHDAESGEAH